MITVDADKILSFLHDKQFIFLSFLTSFQDDCDETRKSSRIVKPPSTPEKRRKGRPRIHPEKRDEEATMESNDEGNADDEDKSSSVIVKEEAPKKKHGRRPEPLKNVQNQDTKESEDKKYVLFLLTVSYFKKYFI